jgi:hypothetical protein
MLTIVAQSWQEIDGTCHYCHCAGSESRITAMTESDHLLTIVFVVTPVVPAFSVIYDDGLSRRQPPATTPTVRPVDQSAGPVKALS